MSVKTAALVAVGLVGAALLYSFVYQGYVVPREVVVSPPPQALSQKDQAVSETSTPAEFQTPATPDTAVDDLIDEALADRDNLDAEVQGELVQVEAEMATVNSLNEVYDTNEIQ